jgi:hypothetical protein
MWCIGTAIAVFIPYRREGGRASCDNAPNTVTRILTATGWRRSWVARGNVGTELAAGNGTPFLVPLAFARGRLKAFRRKAVMRAVTRQPLWPGHQWKPPTRPLRVGGLPFSSGAHQAHNRHISVHHSRPTSTGMSRGCLRSRGWRRRTKHARASICSPLRPGMASDTAHRGIGPTGVWTSIQRSSSSASWCFLHRR